MALEKIYQDGQRVDGLWFDPKSGYIHFLKSINGRHIKFTTKCKMPNVVKARRVSNQRLQEILGSKKKTISLVKDQLPLWTSIKESEGLDYKTIQKINQAKVRIEPFWGLVPCHQIDRDGVAEWMAWMSRQFPGQQKFNAIKYMRNFTKYLVEKSLLPSLPRIVDPDAKKIKAARSRKKGRIFTSAEFIAIYNAGDETQKTVALFMYTMATRIEETLGLTFGRDLIETPEWAYHWSFGQNKADHEGRHLIHPRIIPRLAGYKAGELLFPQKRDKTKPLKAQQIDWADWRRRANLGWHWTSHTFRHTCLSNLFNDPKNPQALICKLYRVSLAVALDVYVKPTPEGIEGMRNAIRFSI